MILNIIFDYKSFNLNEIKPILIEFGRKIEQDDLTLIYHPHNRKTLDTTGSIVAGFANFIKPQEFNLTKSILDLKKDNDNLANNFTKKLFIVILKDKNKHIEHVVSKVKNLIETYEYTNNNFIFVYVNNYDKKAEQSKCKEIECSLNNLKQILTEEYQQIKKEENL